MTGINLGGKYGSLYVEVRRDKYYFNNDDYGMYMTLYKEDVKEYLEKQDGHYWGNHSCSNTIHVEDKKVIRDYLLSKNRKYQTVTDVLKSRSRKKEKILREDFSLNELVEYIGKEKANGEIESGS